MLETSLKTVRTDFRTLIRDARDLLVDAATSTGTRAEGLRDRTLDLLDDAMGKMEDAQLVLVKKGRTAADNTGEYVRDNPIQSVAICVGLGFLLGTLLARR